MLFHEIYSLYYKTVACLINSSFNNTHQIIQENAFKESFMMIEEAIQTNRWPLDNIDHVSSYPLTLLQKRWLKSISLDPRIQLFPYSWSFLDDIEPLFTLEDINIFDQYSDGDPYTDPLYQKNFQTILKAIKSKCSLSITMISQKNKKINTTISPQLLEYSEKDDKIRLIASDGNIINISRIEECYPTDHIVSTIFKNRVEKELVIEIKDERNTLERVLLHFAHFKRQTVLKNNTYLITLYYDEADETEIVIRLLSFGPMIKVIAPLEMKQLLRKRLKKQISYVKGG